MGAMQAPNSGDSEAFSERGADILMTAVRVARDQQITTLAALKQRLQDIFPGEEDGVEWALSAWRAYEVRRGGPDR